jgi:hypothetical protein
LVDVFGDFSEDKRQTSIFDIKRFHGPNEPRNVINIQRSSSENVPLKPGILPLPSAIAQ